MNLIARVTAAALVCLVSSGVRIRTFADPVYHVTYLGFAFSNGIEAKLNNVGQIAGRDANHGFIYNDAAHITDLGAGRAPMAINDAGQVAGFGLFSGQHDAFLYSSGGSPLDLGVLPGNANSDAYGLNAAGDVVGSSALGNGGSPRAFLYRNGAMSDLGSGQANAINSSGDIIGTSAGSRAVRYQNGSMLDLGAFGDTGQTSAADINDLGQIVGSAGVASGGSFPAHPFLYGGGTWHDLGLPAGVPLGYPSAINNVGQIVGNSNLSLGAFNRPPFLYTDGVIYNLQALLDDSGAGLTLQLAYDINDAGAILAQGYGSSGSHLGYQAVLITPVPEPDLNAFGGGIGVLIVVFAAAGRRTARTARVSHAPTADAAGYGLTPQRGCKSAGR
jgi:probable HAF family extracellular repeat protein